MKRPWQSFKDLHVAVRALIILVALGGGVAGYWNVMPLLGWSPALNEAVVEPGKLIRSAQPRVHDLEAIQKEYGLGTILCLGGYETKDVTWWAHDHDVKMIAMEMRADLPPTDRQIALFFHIMRGDTVSFSDYKGVITDRAGLYGQRSGIEFPFPVLIHCNGGADRTGVMVALYRMAFQGWSLKEAKKEMIMHWHIPFSHPAQFEFLDRNASRINRGFGAGTRDAGVESMQSAPAAEGSGS